MNSLWKEFNLAENNQDQSWWILYAMKYSREVLEVKREYVTKAIELLEVKPIDKWDLIEVRISGLSKDDIQRLYLLLEELSVINEALEWKEWWVEGFDFIIKLKNHLIQLRIDWIYNKANSYNSAVEAINLARTLLEAHKENNIFNRKQLDQINELLNPAIGTEEFFNGIRWNKLMIS